MGILVETSARHVHLTTEHIEALFGAGYTLTVKKELSQPGQYACEERVDIIGPKGEITLERGVIVAKRHIHLTPDAAKAFDVTDKQVVSVKIDSDGRSLVFGDVVIRVRDDFAPAMHIDTDESNAALVAPGTYGEIIQ